MLLRNLLINFLKNAEREKVVFELYRYIQVVITVTAVILEVYYFAAA